MTGVLSAFLIYQITINSLNPLHAVNMYGHIPDQTTERIANGISLVTVIIMVNYLDTQSHSVFFELFVFFGGSILITGSYYLA